LDTRTHYLLGTVTLAERLVSATYVLDRRPGNLAGDPSRPPVDILQAAWHSFHRFHIKSRIEDYKQVTGMHRIALLVLAPLVIAIDISTLLMAPLIIPFVALVDYVQTRNEYAWRLLRFYFLFLVSLAGIILVFMNINLQLK
jgi:hypothetical protein